MPSITQTTPTQLANPTTDVVDRNGHTARRARSGKQNSTTTSSPWPVLTHSAYTQLTRGGAVPDGVASKRLRRLAMGRNGLGVALMALQNVMHDHRPGQAGLTPEQVDEWARVWQWARTAYDKVNGLYTGYPLELR